MVAAAADFSNPFACYTLLTQTFVPRPIAWVLTENENGTHNLAPFSYTGAIDYDPPALIFSCGMRKVGSTDKKDTWANLERTKRCVVHIPSVANMEAVNNSAANLGENISEVDTYNIPLTSFKGFPMPRVTDAPIAYGCKLIEVISLGHAPMGLILVEIEQFFVANNVIEKHEDGALHIDEKAINPLTRLGKTKYGTLGELIDIGSPPKPKSAE